MIHHHPLRGTLGVLWLFSVVLILAGCAPASTSTGSTPTKPAPQASPSTAAPVPCQTQQLQLAFDRFGAATGNEGAQFALVNQLKQSCTLSGYPAVQLLDAQHQPIRARVVQATEAFLYNNLVPHQFVLQAGGKAYFVLEWTNQGCGKIPPASYASPISFLRVTLPLSQASLLIAYQFCAFGDSVVISPLEPNKIWKG
jgi:hypothetical protein